MTSTDSRNRRGKTAGSTPARVIEVSTPKKPLCLDSLFMPDLGGRGPLNGHRFGTWYRYSIVPAAVWDCLVLLVDIERGGERC